MTDEEDGDGDDKKEDGEKDDDKSSEGEATEVLFKVKLEKPDPSEVKISKKNCCTVELKNAAKAEDTANEH